MTAVFAHGRLRLYLLHLLRDGPKHGYELIRLLERRFLGRYVPSAGTIYPRLRRLEADGQVRHAVSGGRKVYELTAAGHAELRDRAGELASLESGIVASVQALEAEPPRPAPRRPAFLAQDAGEVDRRPTGSGGVRPVGLVRDAGEMDRRLTGSAGLRPAGAARDSAGLDRRLAGSAGLRPAVSAREVADLDRRLAGFTAEVREVLRAARLAGADLPRLAQALDAALADARRSLKRALR